MLFFLRQRPQSFSHKPQRQREILEAGEQDGGKGAAEREPENERGEDQREGEDRRAEGQHQRARPGDLVQQRRQPRDPGDEQGQRRRRIIPPPFFALTHLSLIRRWPITTRYSNIQHS